MAQAVDFLRLYREFHLEPGASIEDLKRAYRRRVSMVHPDRLSAKDEISQHLATEHLQMLTQLYEAGIQFHRRHGRLPGALPTPSAPREPPAGIEEAAPEERYRSGRKRWIGLALVVGGFIVWAVWALWPAPEPETFAPMLPAAAVRLQPAPDAATAAPEGLRLGMPQRVVVRVIGAPVTREADRWMYGPSWIRFEEGKVVEWYSSPLHPFRISTDGEPWNEP